MKDIYVISPKEEQFNLFYANFRHLPIHFSWSNDLGTASKYLELEQPSFVFLVNEDLNTLLEWIERYQNFNLDIPFLCFAPFSCRMDCIDLWKNGAIDVIFLPVNKKELEYILSALVRSVEVQKGPEIDLTEGRLDDFNLIHLIQTFETGKKSAVLVLEDGIKKGEIEFNNGAVVNASYSNRDPLEAITIMSAWRQGTFRARQGSVGHKKRITLANQQIIMECLNYISSQEKLLNKLPATDEVLYASPSLNFEELSPRDRNQLLAFKDGNNLKEISQMFTGNLNQLLKKIESWLDKKWLVKKDEFEALRKKLSEEEDVSALKKVMQKVFKKGKPENESEEFKARYSFLDKADLAQPVLMRHNEFNNYQRLKSFLDVLEETQ